MTELGKHILVVDDEEINIALFGKMIRHLGYRVTVTVDSLKALKLFQESPTKFDLVLLLIYNYILNFVSLYLVLAN